MMALTKSCVKMSNQFNKFFVLLCLLALPGCSKLSDNGKRVQPPQVAIVYSQSKYILDPGASFITMGPAKSDAISESSKVKTVTKVRFILQGEPISESFTVPFYLALVDKSMNIVHRHDAVVSFKPGDIKRQVKTTIIFQPKDGINASDYQIIASFKLDSKQKRLIKQHQRIIRHKLATPPTTRHIAQQKLDRYKKEYDKTA